MILVTGGAGYIGSHFIKHCLSANPMQPLVVVDDLSEGHGDSLPNSENIRVESVNVGDAAVMQDLLERFLVESVVHFAGSSSVAESQRDPFKYLNNNLLNSLNLFQAMEKAKVRSLVYSSSASVYGNPDSVPIAENHPTRPINTYGLTKLMVEKALESYAQNCGWSCAALRYFNAAGADDSGLIGESHKPETHFIPLLLEVAAGRREHVELYGTDYDTPDGTCIRDYVHVNDLAQAHVLALDHVRNHSGSLIVNLGTASGASLKQVLSLAREVTGHNIPCREAARRDGDPAVLVADCTRAKEVINWNPRYNIDQIIKTAWKWEQNRRY